MKIGLRIERKAFCHMEYRTRLKRQGSEQKRGMSNNEIDEEKARGWRNKREGTESRTWQKQNNGWDKRRQ